MTKKVPPLKRLENMMDFFQNTFQKSGNTRGCPIGNLSLEIADTNERLRVHLADVVESLIKKIELCLKDAKHDKSIPAGLNTADTARFIFQGFEGAVLHMKVLKSIKPFHAFRSFMKGYIKQIKAREKK